MDRGPDDPKAAPNYGWLAVIATLVLFEVALFYVLLVRDTPISPMLRRAMETSSGAFAFLMIVVGVMFSTIGGVIAVASRLRPKPAEAPEPREVEAAPDFSRIPQSHSLFRLPLGLAVPGAIVAWVVPLHFESLLWLLLIVPVGLMALIITMVFLPSLFAPARELSAILGDSRAPRVTALLVAVGASLTAGWTLGGAMTQGWNSKAGIVPGLALLAIARLTFPLRPRRGP